MCNKRNYKSVFLMDLNGEQPFYTLGCIIQSVNGVDSFPQDAGTRREEKGDWPTRLKSIYSLRQPLRRLRLHLSFELQSFARRWGIASKKVSTKRKSLMGLLRDHLAMTCGVGPLVCAKKDRSRSSKSINSIYNRELLKSYQESKDMFQTNQQVF